MDTSRTYAKMANCREIQRGYKWKDGDWLMAIGEPHILNGKVKIYSETNADYYRRYPYLGGFFVWLPRQDQLQEMIKGQIGCSWDSMPDDIFRLLHAFAEEIIESRCLLPSRVCSYYKRFTSMEQLWLAFVMKEKYGKIWNGEGWIKEAEV